MQFRYTLDDVERIFGVTYTPDQRAALENIPFSEAVLAECDATHMLFPGFPLSLLDVRAKFADLFFLKTGGWYAEEQHAFSRASVAVRWHLLRMEPVPKSFSKTWGEQNALLLSEEEVPSSALVAYATMLHFGASGQQRLFKRCYVRTSDVCNGGGRVDVGLFDADGFLVYYGGSGVNSFDNLGLSASRKI